MQFFKISALSALFVLAAANPIATPVEAPVEAPAANAIREAAAQGSSIPPEAPCTYGAWRCYFNNIQQCNNGWKTTATCGSGCFFTNGSPHCR